ncbi:Ribonuclease H-like domain,Elongin A binding-protein 1,Exonuclease, RNase T/DNA polymerase III,RNA [Cinara cedri]|uniref:Ribonuclease H-like domain,Elongin A binding-protein 1,Exonuclease, RNase T/DNA polymerase III,RNA n=1 Tax=Cinara cedri TaxID=506608 RepID=A0A5E4NJC8_9HEMI|nr:Ribonuclease H-like domain,Elongin A binding-protein 1,Exonuclease, RNase T/DNA polymerase III,RNA [Cinara cedri]
MLPSKGYFKALECPYYTESFCDRPYCHFKHSKQDFLSDLDCQNTIESENNTVSTSHEPKLAEEPKLKQKVKSKIIEYVPQYIKSKNSELVKKSCIYGSSTEMDEKKTPILEYIPSRLNDTNVNFESNIVFNDIKHTESIKYTEELSKTLNISKQNSNIAEYVPTVIKKPTDLKTNKDKDEHSDKHRREHRTSSKRKHESSRHSSKSSEGSSKSSSRSKKPRKDKSPEPLKIKKEQFKEEKRHSRDQNNKHNIKLNTATIASGQKSLKEAVMEKVKNKLVKSTIVKTDLKCSSDEDNLESMESELMDFFSSEDSDSEPNEQKTCLNVVEAKIKKRISHISSSSIFSKINANRNIKPKCTKSLQEMVATRVQTIQNSVISVGLAKRPKTNLNTDPTLPTLKSKTRIAHQPKIESETTEFQTSQSSKINNKEITTNVKLNLKIKSFKSSNNMPNPLRQSCLEKLYTAFINHYSSEEAIDKAYTTEEEVHNKAKSTGIYRNLIVQSLMKANKSPELQVKMNPNYPSHMHGVCLYELLKKYILSKDDLEKNGYPLMGDNNLAYISKNAYYYQPLSKKRNGDKFICMNCKNEFEVNKQGMPTITLTKCIYHSGKLKFERPKNEKFWLCCYRRQHESGCETSIYHVPDKLDDDALENFVVTKSISNKNIESPNFYALDCEMVNTTIGIEIVRVTVINHEGEEVYESKVKPKNMILDYKSKYSGITEESLKNCSKRLLDVQLDLLKIFDKNTILIGHSLESDLKALKIVHYNVVDTSIIYPHKYGPPYKWGLKLLSEQHLQRIIQSEEGHDSKEDALASLDLVWKKLKEDVKKFKPVNIISIDKK